MIFGIISYLSCISVTICDQFPPYYRTVRTLYLRKGNSFFLILSRYVFPILSVIIMYDFKKPLFIAKYARLFIQKLFGMFISYISLWLSTCYIIRADSIFRFAFLI